MKTEREMSIRSIRLLLLAAHTDCSITSIPITRRRITILTANTKLLVFAVKIVIRRRVIGIDVIEQSVCAARSRSLIDRIDISRSVFIAHHDAKLQESTCPG